MYWKGQRLWKIYRRSLRVSVFITHTFYFRIFLQRTLHTYALELSSVRNASMQSGTHCPVLPATLWWWCVVLVFLWLWKGLRSLMLFFFPSFFWWNRAAMIVASMSSLSAQSLSGGCGPHDQLAMTTFWRPQPTFDNLRFYFSNKRVVCGSSLLKSLLSVLDFRGICISMPFHHLCF